MLIQDYLDICDPVLTFDRFMGEIELEKYLKNIPQHYTGRFRYAPVSMLKTVLFGFMANGYISLRELEDQCKVNLRFMYLMDHQTPSYRTFGYFINEVLADSIEEIFRDINKKIFETEHGAHRSQWLGTYICFPKCHTGDGSCNNYTYDSKHKKLAEDRKSDV